MRYLLISILLFCVGCTTYPKQQNFMTDAAMPTVLVLNPYFSNSKIDYIYRANITVYDNAFGGIFIVKKITKNEHRVVFTTEMGNKIFDFTYTKKDFKVNFIIDKLNNRLLINVLKKDFKVLITEEPLALKNYIKNEEQILRILIYKRNHYYFYENEVLKKIIRAKFKKEKVIFKFSNIKDDIAKNIEIKHHNIKLLIKLKKI